MSGVETLVLSQLGFHAATGINCGKIGERPPELVAVDNMGITFYRRMPDRFGDCIFLFNCRNVPEDLPEWLERSDVKASDFVNKSAMTQGYADDIEREARQ